jgi:4-amino-4-deoxychorismate lyase
VTGSGAFPPDDRGLAYGDGLFETMRVVAGAVPLLQRHLDRLVASCERIRLRGVDRDAAARRIMACAESLDDGVVKLIPRIHAAAHALTSFPRNNYTEGVDVAVCKTRIARSPDTAGLKHLGRLEQVLASGELPEEVAEGLMLDETGVVVEGTRSNLFIVEGGTLATPGLERAGVAGVMRSIVIDEAEASGIPVRSAAIDLARLSAAEEIFITNSIFGIWPVRSIGDVGWHGERGRSATTLMDRVANLGVRSWAP